ncbi:uncharacterized protein LOC123529924 [Mercenaria mercenaria]|uniref:uncharacterized protein LOC123529924 n=1 Tax=Mercenaria mercenaria TaxID=6596 RepID=UPI00234EC603|nr:uncharacterized protein LOC123529924 [Mercenaria mercenaria]
MSAAMWDCIDADGDEEDMANAISQFADDCQTTLGLAFWPAERTCLEFENDFNLYPYMGTNCWPECPFGLRETSTSACECDDGYWNGTCTGICPGGVQNPCSGYGTCDSVTGECNCPINRMPADDCSLCSEDWYGSDCEIAVNNVTGSDNTSLAVLGQLGIIYTFDGLSYSVKTQGELMLMAISENIIIEGKFVTCYQNYSCVPFIAARIGDGINGYATVTVQSERKYDSKPMIYINGVSDTLDTPAYFNGFKVYRSNFFEVTFEVKDIVTFYIRNEGQYLHLTLELVDTLVTQTSGLLSGGLYANITDRLDHLYNAEVPLFAICNDTSSIQSAQGSQSSNTISLTAYTQTYSNDTDLDISRFIVDECDSIIYFSNDLLKYQTQGGYGLNFSKSSLDRELVLDTSSTTSMTIELLVKQNEANNSGVIFSYTSSSSSSLLLVSGESSLEVHTYVGSNETMYDTAIALDEDAWNKVVFAYDNDDGTSTVYVIDKDGTVSTTGDFEINPALFESTGTLTIGHWNMPFDSKQYDLPNGFDGSLENFMIWNLTVEESQVSELWQMDPATASGSLLFALQFDEGDGTLTSDNIGNLDLSLPEYPWKAPEWIISDLDYISSYTPDFALTYFNNDTWETEASTFCLSITTATDGISISNSTRNFFYLNCLQNLAVTEYKTSGYNAILDALVLGVSQHGTASSEIDTFCSAISDTDKNGTSCTTTCTFGIEYSNGTCSCFEGYYGANCDGVCPGSSDSPCSLHGECLSDGTCDCWWNWGGSLDCSSCTSDSSGDMVGPDCSILSTSSLSSSSSKVAAVSSNGHYMTFDGQQISFIGETGAFMLFSSSLMGVDIHVYQVSCHYGSCVAAVSLTSSTDDLVIAAPGQGIYPVLYRNGKQIILDDITNVFSASMTVTQDSLTDISVTITGIGSITVQVLVQEQFLQASVVSSSTICQVGSGVFDKCNGNGKDYSSMTTSEINEYIVTNYRLSSSIILDALNAPVGDGSNITGYALKFDRTAGISVPMSYPADFNISVIDFSLSLYFKPLALGGYIVSYAKNTTFAVLNSDPITFQCDTSFVESTISPELNVWNQLILTFRRTQGTVDLFHFGTDSKLTQEVVNFECGSIFESDGTIMLGEYMPSVGSNPYTFGSQYFTGLIDEFSIWKNPIPNSLIYQAHLLSTKVSGFSSELASLISFSEGVGAVAYEEINGNNMVLPIAPWQSPEWIVSDLGLQPLRTTVSEVYSTINIDANVETMCGNFFDSGSVSSNCGGVSDFIRWWFKQTCMIIATNTGNISDTTMAMADYTSLCGVTGGNVDNIYDVLCALSVDKPAWLERKCSDCDFGYKTGTECVCYYGYYGTSCDGVCPGGASNPCNSQGECDVGGNCQCWGRWTGTACDTCSSGWSGDDCTVYTSTFDPLGDNATTLVAQVNMIGQLSTFDGIILDMPQRGYFNLMTINDLDISLEGRFGVCNSEDVFHVCLIGFVLEHGGESYYVSYERFTGTSVEIMSSTSPNITVYDEFELGDMILKLDSPTTLKMTMKGSDIAVKMSSISDRLLSTLSIPMTEWTSRQSQITGVLTSCNTEKAIIAANCSISRQSLCIDPSQTISSSCKLNQTTETFSQFLNNSAYNDTDFMELIEDRYLSAMESNCFKYDGNGVSVTDLPLPDSDFTVEMHAKPTDHGGILLTYDDANGNYITLINHKDGMIVALPGVYHLTNLPLELDVWNQISLAWRDDAQILEVYLTNDTGVSTVKAVPLTTDVFNSGGTLTLGQLTPDLGVSISMGDYTGYIDEVRIWNRPHNPTVITNNFRKMITDDTSNVWHSWTFNEGIGLTAYEDRQGDNMVPVNLLTPPVWAKSSLDLSEDKDLDAPRLTTEDELSAAALLAAQQMCDNLISNFSLSIIGSSMDVLTDVYEALCVQEITATGDQAQAEAVLASAADLYISLSNSSTNPLASLCNVMSSVSTYIGASGDNCTTCVFGTVDNGTCVCFDTHWGQSCDSICPIGPLGACNTFGVCDEGLGVCNCHPKHYAGSSTVSDFWQTYLTSSSMNMTSDYTCDACSENWHGKECEYSTATPKSSSSYYGIIYGSYVTNFEGVSYTHVAPGVYSLLKTSSMEAQALFVPCLGDNRCRYMKEFAVRKGDSSIMIQHAEDTGQNVTVKVDGIDVLFPNTSSSSGVTVEMTEYPYVKVTVGSSSFIVFDSDMGLVTTAEVSSGDAKANSGLLGKPDNDWTQDFQCTSDTGTLNKDDLSSEYAGKCLRERYGTGSGQIFTNHTDSEDFLSSGGYSLSLSGGEGFTVNGFTVEQGLTKFTSSYWVKSSKASKKRSTLTHPLLTIDAGSQNIDFRVDSDYLVIDWDIPYTTTLMLDIDTWYYLAFSWSDDGSAVVYLISDNNVQDYSISNMNVGGTVDVSEITMTTTTSAQVSFDCLRSWTETKTLSESISDMDNYCDDSTSSDASMMLSITFDEGNGTTTSITTYSTNDGTNSGSVTGTVAGTISGLTGASNPWVPSSIPVPDISTANTLTAYGRSSSNSVLTNYTAAATACLDVIKNDNISTTCSVLSSGTIDHFLEACIRDYDRIGEQEAQRILESTLIYYCATAMGGDECQFVGYFYFCKDVEEEAAGLPLIIIAAAAGGALLLIGLIILIICLKKKKQKEKERAAAEDDPSLSLVSNTKFNTTALRRNTTETSFVSMDSRRQSAWDDGGRNSVVSVNSPVMFSDDEPSSPTPSTSGSFFKKGTVSPMTVAPLTEQKKIAVNNWSKLVQKATENGPVSPHPAPNPSTTAPNKKVEPAKRYITTSPEPGTTSTSTSPVSPAPVANWGKLLEKALNSGATSPQFSSIPGSETSTPMPAVAPNAPTGMFGMSPQPMFGSNAAAVTPKPAFAADAPTSLGGSNAKQWKKPAPIPRLPQNARKSSVAVAPDRPDSVVNDLDTA